MKKSAVLSLSVYSALHFAVDLTCAMTMFARVRPESALWGAAMLIYNFLAFAMQLPFGIIADRLGKNSLVAGAGCVFVGLGCLLAPFPMAAAVLSGLGNGLFHVGGGLDALNGRNGKCAPAGIFVSPGALGLWLGTVWGSAGGFSAVPGAALIAIGAALPFLLTSRRSAGENAELEFPPLSSPAYAGAALLFLVVVLRGLAGMLFSFPWKAEFAFFYILAVVLGKAAGGFAADLFGQKTTAAVSLALAGAMFLLANSPAFGIFAVFLFNMTMPLTLTAAADSFSGAKGMSFGLMTFGLFCGFLPVYFGFSSGSLWLYLGLSAASLGLILPGLILCERGRKK